MDLETFPLINSNKILKNHQSIRNCVLYNNEIYLSYKQKQKRNWKIQLISAITIILVISALSTITVKIIYTPFNVLFINYNNTLFELTNQQNIIKNQINYIEQTYPKQFSSVYNKDWFTYNCHQISLCFCDLYQNPENWCNIVIDFTNVLNNFNFVLSFIESPCEDWYDTYGTNGVNVCDNLYTIGANIQNNNIDNNNILNAYYNYKKQYADNQNAIISVKTLINDGAGIINYTALLIYLAILFIFISSSFLGVIIYFCFKHKMINNQNIEGDYYSFLRKINPSKNKFTQIDVNNLVCELTEVEEKRVLYEKQILAFLSGSIDRNSNVYHFLNTCGKDIKKYIISLIN